MTTIITHPGSAHKDDFLSTCVLLATLDEPPVWRRDPTAADLADPDTWIVDVGMEYAPERHNFDHHHDRTLPCSFHLLMQHFGLHEAAQQVFVWYPYMSLIDVRGPYRTAEQLGVDSKVLFAMSSPIDGFILATFARYAVLEPDDPFYVQMRNLGRDLLDMITAKRQRLKQLAAVAEVVPVGSYKALVSPIEEAPKLALDLYLLQLDDELIVMSIIPSSRGAGWELLRLGGNHNIDFRRLTGRPELRFVHNNGFMATTRDRLPLAAVLELAALAIIDD